MEESASKNKHGVGLGLSICKSLIELMNGSIRVESIEGQGTTFIITFQTHCTVSPDNNENESSEDSVQFDNFYDRPQQNEEVKVLNEPVENTENIELAVVPRMPKISDSEQPSILVVNENFVILDILSYRLQPYFIVHVADCGMDAIEIVNGRPLNYFDVILMDINMPLMDGFETIEKIKVILQSQYSFCFAKMLSIAELPNLGGKTPSSDPPKLDFLELIIGSVPEDESS